ncbi:hypothetical protein FGO68_gene2880 [Halteria grandinella]|uniref:Uncharacterized protein n=1 Tax=Halteria grandinella TaxID=5974 RepID=A0A8J8T3Y3_HALGN|nr:hypothetical protein FGO68_gene2880 [Halteria grandinella]
METLNFQVQYYSSGKCISKILKERNAINSIRLVIENLNEQNLRENDHLSYNIKVHQAQPENIKKEMLELFEKIASLEDTFTVNGLKIIVKLGTSRQELEELRVRIELLRPNQSNLTLEIEVDPLPISLLLELIPIDFDYQLAKFKNVENFQIEIVSKSINLIEKLVQFTNAIIQERGSKFKKFWFSMPSCQDFIIGQSLIHALNQLKGNIANNCKNIEELYLCHQGDPNLQQDLFELSLGNTLPHLKRLYVPQIIEQLPIIEHFKLNQTSKFNPNLQQIIVNHVPYFKGKDQWEILKQLSYAMKPHINQGQQISIQNQIEKGRNLESVDIDEFAEFVSINEPNIMIDCPTFYYGLFKEDYKYDQVKRWKKIMDLLNTIKNKH